MSTLPHGRGSTGTTTEKDWGVKQQKAKQEMGQNANEERYGRATGVKVTLKNMLTTKRAPIYLMIFT